MRAIGEGEGWRRERGADPIKRIIDETPPSYFSEHVIGLPHPLGYIELEAESQDGFFWASRSILGGEGIPVALFPVGLLSIIKILPFRYMYSFPLELALGKLSTSEVIFGFVAGLTWIFILTVIYKIMWEKGTKTYTSAGV